jgi:hypothetical protein
MRNFLIRIRIQIQGAMGSCQESEALAGMMEGEEPTQEEAECLNDFVSDPDCPLSQAGRQCLVVILSIYI